MSAHVTQADLDRYYSQHQHLHQAEGEAHMALHRLNETMEEQFRDDVHKQLQNASDARDDLYNRVEHSLPREEFEHIRRDFARQMETVRLESATRAGQLRLLATVPSAIALVTSLLIALHQAGVY